MAIPYWTTYEVVPGFDNSATAVNFEDYFRDPLRGERVPDGTVVERAADGWETTDGWQDFELTQEICPFSELTAYVTAIFGGWDGPDTAEVTIRARKTDNTFDYFNAYAFKPKALNGDYEHLTSDLVTDIHLRFQVLGEAA